MPPSQCPLEHTYGNLVNALIIWGPSPCTGIQIVQIMHFLVNKILFVVAYILFFLHVCHMEDIQEGVDTVDHMEGKNEGWPVWTV